MGSHPGAAEHDTAAFNQQGSVMNQLFVGSARSRANSFDPVEAILSRSRGNSHTDYRPSPKSLQYTPGEVVLYEPTGEKVLVIEAHIEEYPYYYLVRMGDQVTVKSITFEKLKPLHTDVTLGILSSSPINVYMSGAETELEPELTEAEIQAAEELEATLGPAPTLGTCHAVLCAFGAGLVVAQADVFGKATAEMLQDPLTAFTKWQFYLMLSCMIGTLLLQLVVLNRALEHHNALLVVPMYQTFWMLTSIVGGGIYFDEFSLFEPLNFCVFPVGVFITLIGIYTLTYSQARDDQEAEKDFLEGQEGGEECMPGGQGDEGQGQPRAIMGMKEALEDANRRAEMEPPLLSPAGIRGLESQTSMMSTTSTRAVLDSRAGGDVAREYGHADLRLSNDQDLRASGDFCGPISPLSTPLGLPGSPPSPLTGSAAARQRASGEGPAERKARVQSLLGARVQQVVSDANVESEADVDRRYREAAAEALKEKENPLTMV